MSACSTRRWPCSTPSRPGPLPLAELVAATGLSPGHGPPAGRRRSRSTAWCAATTTAASPSGLRLVGLGRAAADGCPARPRPPGPRSSGCEATRARACSSTCATATTGSASPSLESPHELRTIVPVGAAPAARPSARPARLLPRPTGAGPARLGRERRGARAGRGVGQRPGRGPDGRVLAAVSVSGPIERTTRRPAGATAPRWSRRRPTASRGLSIHQREAHPDPHGIRSCPRHTRRRPAAPRRATGPTARSPGRSAPAPRAEPPTAVRAAPRTASRRPTPTATQSGTPRPAPPHPPTRTGPPSVSSDAT